MTIENAIKYGQESLDTDVHYVKSGTGFFESHSDFVKTSLEALELQVPKKPKVTSFESCVNATAVLRAVCPNCNGSVIHNDRYCHDCGQRIDWE